MGVQDRALKLYPIFNHFINVNDLLDGTQDEAALVFPQVSMIRVVF